MPNPFPGINPYLEQPEYWSDFHNQFITALARKLIPQLLPKYRVVTDKWFYKVTDSTKIVIGRPDVTVQKSRDILTQTSTTVTASKPSVQQIKVAVPLREEIQQSYIEVKDVATQEVVTAIEVLSPANRKGEGRQKYEAKRQQILESKTHFIEIDLLRDGEPLPVLETNHQSHYRLLVTRSNTRPIADLYLFNLGDRIPSFQLPLLSEDTEPIVELQVLLNELYDQLGYDYFINYQNKPPLPWIEDDVVFWTRN